MFAALLVAAAQALTPPQIGAAPDGVVQVTLPDAMGWIRRDDRVERSDLILDLIREDGRWHPRVWGHTPYLPGQEHPGRIVEAGRDALRIEMEVRSNRNRPMAVGGRLSIRLPLDGGPATLEAEATDVDAQRDAIEIAWGLGEAPFAGWHTQRTLARMLEVTLAGTETQAPAHWEARPDLPAVTALRVPTGHPRLLFTRDDLPELRRRAATPLGQAIMARMREALEQPPHNMITLHAAALGLLWHLEGLEGAPDRAFRMCAGAMVSPFPYGQWNDMVYRIMGVALAYDLFHEAWTEEQRRHTYTFLERVARHLAMRQDSPEVLDPGGRYVFPDDQSGFGLASTAHGMHQKHRAAAALGVLAILGDPVPIPAPQPLHEARPVPPAHDYEPWIGVPVVPFESDRMPSVWLINGPFPSDAADPLAEIGGWAEARPEVGTRVTVDGVPLDFRRMWPSGQDSATTPSIYPRESGRHWASATGGGYWPGIGLARRWAEEQGRRISVSVALYTVIRNDRPRVVQARPNWGSTSTGVRMWLNGVALEEGELARLEPGLYPLMVHLPVASTYSNQSPRLKEVTEADHAQAVADHEAAMARFGAPGAENELMSYLEVFVRSLRRHIEEAIGDDGWGDRTSQTTLLPFLNALVHTTGVDLARGTGLSESLRVAARMRGYHHAWTWDTAAGQGLRFLPRDQIPAARAYFDAHGPAIRRPSDAILALTTYPFEVSPRPLASLQPLSGDYASRGVAAFRSAWDRPFGQVTVHRGWGDSDRVLNEAGSFSVGAFGYPFLAPSGQRHTWNSMLTQNLVQIAGHYPAAPAELLASDFRSDGSGAVTFRVPAFRKGTLSENGRTRITYGRPDPDMAWTRSVAVDWRGWPDQAVVVVADTLEGAAGIQKTWRMRTSRHRDGIQVDDLGQVVQFTSQGRNAPPQPVQARLHVLYPTLPNRPRFRVATFGDSPTGIVEVITDPPRGNPYTDIRQRGRGRDSGDDAIDTLLREVERDEAERQRRLAAEAGETDGFLTVLVLGPRPPEISAEGKGMNRLLRVGPSTVRVQDGAATLE